MTILFPYFLTTIFGLILGSFINVVALRDAQRKTIVAGRSACLQCKHELGARDLVPILSFLWNRGKCRFCKKPISIRYPLVEIFTAGMLSYLFFMVQQHEGSLLFYILFAISFLLFEIVALIDLETSLVPMDYIGISALFALATHLLGESESIRSVILGGVGAGLVIWLIRFLWFYFFKQEGMGDGDIYIAGLMGLLLGFPLVFSALIMAVFLGAIIGVGMIYFQKNSASHQIPFGPFLFLGSLLALNWGQMILNWYIL